MQRTLVDEAITLLEKANAELEPDLLSVGEARDLLGCHRAKTKRDRRAGRLKPAEP